MRLLERKKQLKTVMDREMLMRLKTCAACGQPFSLGDPVVLADGAWKGQPQVIHENEAVFDEISARYVERKMFKATARGA